MTDPRPIAAALRLLEKESGAVITYEDLRYQHPSELEDITERVRKDLGKFEPEKAPRVWGPRRGTLAFKHLADDRGQPVDLEAAIQAVLQADPARGSRFRLSRDESGAFHVAAIKELDAKGMMVLVPAALDTMIEIPELRRTGQQLLEAICAAVSAATGSRLIPGTAPSNALNQYQTDEGTHREPARVALQQLLMGVNRRLRGGRLSWTVLHDATNGGDIVNVHLVQPVQSP